MCPRFFKNIVISWSNIWLCANDLINYELNTKNCKFHWGDKGTTIFQCLIHNLLDVVAQTKFMSYLLWPAIKITIQQWSILRKNDYLGYSKEHLWFFSGQEMAPATDKEGKISSRRKNKLATSPNGNGGWYSSLVHADIRNFFCLKA